ncbi:PDZ domain-containing protein [Burkholderia cenocepacia]|uniref:PDZ domain-containing protein n=1 Tax=Burkholderia cenocepacia TaxID=95486 RepID=UPI00073D49C0|nr:PDZ domain-containing protein [Burkholderia cenocepacia]
MASIEFKRIELASLAIATLSSSCMSKELLAPTLTMRASQGVLPATPDMPTYPGIVSDFENKARLDIPAVAAIIVFPIDKTSSVRQLWPPPGVANNLFLRFVRAFPRAPGITSEHRHASGFIASPDGDILTDAGDIAGGSRISVTVADERIYRAKLIGTDRASGIALIRIREKGLPIARIGLVSSVKAGEWVISIGSPFGLGNSIVRCIASNTSRLLPDQLYVPLIQTNLMENTGVDGSSLLSFKGDVIGIETPLPDDGNPYLGLAFAMPIGEAMKVERQLKLHDKAVHRGLGVAVQEVADPLARSFELTRPKGALVTSVDSGSPAAKAGIWAGDIVVRINGNGVPDSTHFPTTVANLSHGTAIDLAYWRDLSIRHATLVSSAMGTNNLSPSAYGLGARNLTRDEARTARIHCGVRVEQSSGPAVFVGIESDDIILKMDNMPVTSTAKLYKTIARPAHNVDLLVDRTGMRMFVTMDVR